MIPGGEPVEEEGSYLVSVSDLMVGLLFVFLLMLMAFALQYRVQQEAFQHQAEREQTLLRQKNSELERQLLALSEERQRVVGALKAEIDAYEVALRKAQTTRLAMLTSLRDRLRQDGVLVEIDAGNGVLRLPDAVLFQSLSALLSDAPVAPGRLSPREIVRRLARAMAEIVPCYAVAASSVLACPASASPVLDSVFIEGHTDQRPIAPGSRFSDNYDLSAARALSTYRALLADQPELREIRNANGERLFGLSGYGPDRPVSVAEDEAAFAANRRIDVRFLLAAPSAARMDRLRDSLDAILAKPDR